MVDDVRDNSIVSSDRGTAVHIVLQRSLSTGFDGRSNAERVPLPECAFALQPTDNGLGTVPWRILYNPSPWSPAPAAGLHLLTPSVSVLHAGVPLPVSTRRLLSRMRLPSCLSPLLPHRTLPKAEGSRRARFS